MEQVLLPKRMALLDVRVICYHKDEEIVSSWNIVMEKQNIKRQMNYLWYQQRPLKEKVDIISYYIFHRSFLIPQDCDSKRKKYITHFFLPLHPGNSPFPMRVYKKSTIGIISNHSLQHPSGYYFLSDSMCAGGVSSWNVEVAFGRRGCVCCGICSRALSS